MIRRQRLADTLVWAVVIALTALGLILLSVGQASAQGLVVDTNGIPGDCPYTDGAYYQQDVFPRYDSDYQRLLLVQWTSGGTVAVLAQSLYIGALTDDYLAPVFRWSPDCRFLSSPVGDASPVGDVQEAGPYHAYALTFWDVTTGQRLYTMQGVPRGHVAWDPTSSYVLAVSQGQMILWHIPTGRIVPLDTPALFSDDGRFFLQVHWDFTRGQLLAVSAGDPTAVRAYDLATGALLARYDNPAASVAGFVLSPDDSTIAVFTHVQDSVSVLGESLGKFAGATVWNRDTQQQVRIEHAFMGLYPTQVAISPDNRYLVVGFTALNVWDLQNLTEEPLHAYDGPFPAQIVQVRFLQAACVETTAMSGSIQRWDIHSGAEIPGP